MIINKPEEHVVPVVVAKQRLSNKTSFTTLVPNQNNKNIRYFSSVDAEIYFEDLFIDECVQINFSIQQQTLPIFGYNSYLYDDIALGSRLINGQFTINFTKASYLYDVLNTLTGVRDLEFTNTIDEHKPLWGKTFDIYMSYGDARQANKIANSTILVLKEVSITGCNQDLDYTGKPVYETYTFLARDIDFLSEGNFTYNNQENKEENNNNAEQPIKSIKISVSDFRSYIAINILFNPDFIIEEFEYAMDFSNAYRECKELENINTNEKPEITINDSSDNMKQYIQLMVLKDQVEQQGNKFKNYFLNTKIRCRYKNGDTKDIEQKLQIL